MDYIPDPKRVKHFNIESHVHLLTFSCYLRQPLLQNDEWRILLSKYIDRAVTRHNFGIVAFVYMPEHLHLLVNPKSPDCAIEDLLYAIKKPFSSCIKQRLAAARDPRLNEMTITERPGKKTFRFWQEGPGHDRNLLSVENCIKAAEYLHNNPVRRRLCETPDQWKWSSWKHYHDPQNYDTLTLPRIDGFPA